MDLMDGGEDGTARWVHVLDGSDVSSQMKLK